MRAGLLNESITIQRSKDVRDSFGSNSKIWQDHIKTKANIKNNSNRIAEVNNEIVRTSNIDITIRIYHDVINTDRIIYNNAKYRIISIFDDKRDQSKKIITEQINE